MSISVCIATHERPELLRGTLEAIGRQSLAPGEVVVSDSSRNGATRDVVAAFGARRPECIVRYLPSARAALPWQRWWAAAHAAGDWILFLDDDVRLGEEAIEALDRARATAVKKGPVAGIGFVLTWDGPGEQPRRDTTAAKERWLGTAGYPPGALTPGGQTVSFFGLPPGETVEVDALWGGAMAFPRDVLRQLSCLDNLVALYESGFGRGEDGVLSRSARAFGRLWLVNRPLAFHPRSRRGPAPYARSGWRLGMTATWGRAHTMRWLASDPHAYLREWRRLAALEIGRALTDAARRPWRGDCWTRIAGAAAGIARSVVRWREIPSQPRSRDRWEGAA